MRFRKVYVLKGLCNALEKWIFRKISVLCFRKVCVLKGSKSFNLQKLHWTDNFISNFCDSAYVVLVVARGKGECFRIYIYIAI